MDFRLDPDQLALQGAAKDFLRKEVTSTVVRTAFDSPDGDSPELYKKMAELGWLGIAVSEDLGGVGMSIIEQAVVCEQLGYVNAPGAYTITATAAIPALVALGATDLLPALLDGSKRATVATGTEHVIDAQMADAVLVIDEGKVTWYESDAFEVTPRPSVDGTRRQASVKLTGKGRELGPSTELEFGVEPGPARAIDFMTALLCAEMVGGMQWALDTTVQYVKDREAFGRPIGVFQAVQHKCADMLVHTETSRSAAYYAAYAIANELPDARFATSVAKAYCSDAAHSVTGECIQLHGGIGFTWEHDAHLYFKRATTNRILLGDAAFHRERALQLDPQAL
jgi:alkylation response protein AidB-like acyl-CoA dehydrogenase